MKGLFAAILVLGLLYLKCGNAGTPEQERKCVQNCMKSGYDMIVCNNNICPSVIECCNIKGAEIGNGIVAGKMSNAECCNAVGSNGASVFETKHFNLDMFAKEVAKSSEEK
ncbi:uncharacterized protein LOC135499801 [Lineus longissimus]|uniref:uncharacterized protein LOC135499801 n=1 Tax=Lineus longissimus TaxID=88925 RepID=UPI002B4F1405